MKKIVQFLDLFRMLIILPLKISDGNKKEAYQQIKRRLIEVNLL
ncbi:hypothetical protein [Tenacibaculum aestuariivivum]